jgi:hypothetical protein
MTISTQEYANLADDAYINRSKDMEKDHVPIGGVKYKVLATDDKWSGFQGTAYIRLDADKNPIGEVIIAYRGTSSVMDGVVDAGMAVANVNAQAPDAEKFTEHVLAIAKTKGMAPDGHLNITVTGHSLGGTLAELMAWRHGLHGETFNAYGAVGLDRNIPADGAQVIDHVRATDVVSAANAHFGQVRVYATADDIAMLHKGHYLTGDDSRQANPMLVAPAAVTQSHAISNFMPNPQTGVSIMTAGNAARARAHAQEIGHFRQDVLQDRMDYDTVLKRLVIPGASPANRLAAQGLDASMTLGGQALAEQARRAAHQTDQAWQSLGDQLERNTLQATLGLSHDLNQAMQRTGAAITTGAQALADQARQTVHTTDRAVTGAQDAFLHGAVNFSNTANHALEQVGLGPPGGSHPHARQFAQPTPATPTAPHPAAVWSAAQPAQKPIDPREQQHPDHKMYLDMREQLVAFNQTQNIKLTPQQLENGVAALMADARAEHIHTVTQVGFAVFPKTDQIDRGHMLVYQGHPDDLTGSISTTDMARAIDTPAEQSYQKFEQNTQAMAQQQQVWQQQFAAQEQSQDMSMQR